MVIATLYGYKIKGEEKGRYTSFQGQGLMKFLFALELAFTILNSLCLGGVPLLWQSLPAGAYTPAHIANL